LTRSCRSRNAQGGRLLSSPAAAQSGVQRLDQEIRDLLQLLQRLESQLPVTPERAVRHHDLMRGTVITVAVISLVTLSLMAIAFSLLGRLSRLWAANQASAAADRVRTDFVSFISHELRNSITGLQSGVSLVLDEGLPADTRRQVANAITHSVGALSRLVVNLLSADRAGRGRLQPRVQPVSASAVVAETLGRILDYHEALHDRLRVSAPEGISVMADPDYLDLILSNLIDNARKFSPEGIPIEVAVSRDDGRVLFSVRDHGVGIAAEKAASIFEPFESYAGPGHMSGTGVGLYLCKRLADAQSGSIEVKSAPGEGSTFTVILPAARGKD
jgi:signal transduction histidine kinase